MWNVLRSQNISGAGRHVVVYLDDAVNLEIGVELKEPYTGDGQVVASGTPAGRVVTTMHVGPYGNLGSAHEAVQEWCRTNGHELAGLCWEIYGHWQEDWNENPERIRTEVCYLVK